MGAAFFIPAAIAAVSAGAGYVNQNNANKRGQNAEVQALQNEQGFRNQANNLVKQQTQQIATSNPTAAANTEESQFVNNLRQNEAGSAAGGPTNTNTNTFGQPVSALASVPGASKAYNAGTKASQNEVQQYGTTEAGEESAVDAAVRQRQNEGLQMQTLGTNLNTINQNAQMQGFVDQLRARTAATPNPWVSMLSQIGGATANSMAKNGWFAPSPQVTAPEDMPADAFLGNGGAGASYPVGLPGSTPYMPSSFLAPLGP